MRHRRLWGTPTLLFAVAASFLAGIVAAPAPVQAQTPVQALDFTGGGATTLALDRTLGWKFTASSTFLVTDLGIFDWQNDGLANNHRVGLWDSQGNLLTSTTIFASNTGTSAVVSSASGKGSFRYSDVSGAAVLLTAGETYTIGAEYSGSDPDSFLTNASTVTTASGISYAGSVQTTMSGFDDPKVTSTANAFFGPNLRITAYTPPAAVPEFGSSALLGVGLISLAAPFAARGRRRRHCEC